MKDGFLLPMRTIAVIDILDCIRPKGLLLLSYGNLLSHIHMLGNDPVIKKDKMYIKQIGIFLVCRFFFKLRIYHKAFLGKIYREFKVVLTNFS